MTHKSETQVVVDVDALRRELCRHMAAAMQAGTFGFQIRILSHDGKPSEALGYLFHDHTWHKQDGFHFTADTARELLTEFEHLSSREFADAWDCRRIDHPDRTDFELKFHREKVEEHLRQSADKLQSFLIGCLFFGHHDTGQDSRHRIRFQGH